MITYIAFLVIFIFGSIGYYGVFLAKTEEKRIVYNTITYGSFIFTMTLLVLTTISKDKIQIKIEQIEKESKLSQDDICK
jgi:hypothetical protein